MKKTIFLISLWILFSFVTPALSSDHKKGHDCRGHFGDMDLDDNDQVSWEEFKKHKVNLKVLFFWTAFF